MAVARGERPPSETVAMAERLAKYRAFPNRQPLPAPTGNEQPAVAASPTRVDSRSGVMLILSVLFSNYGAVMHVPRRSPRVIHCQPNLEGQLILRHLEHTHHGNWASARSIW
jgi:hypothetical protein